MQKLCNRIRSILYQGYQATFY